MGTLLEQRITRLRWLGAFLHSISIAVWVCLMLSLPLEDGETLTSLSTKCALGAALMLIGKVPSRLKSGIRNTCLCLAWIVLFLSTPTTLTWDLTAKLSVALVFALGVLDLIVDDRLSRLNRSRELYHC